MNLVMRTVSVNTDLFALLLVLLFSGLFFPSNLCSPGLMRTCLIVLVRCDVLGKALT